MVKDKIKNHKGLINAILIINFVFIFFSVLSHISLLLEYILEYLLGIVTLLSLVLSIIAIIKINSKKNKIKILNKDLINTILIINIFTVVFGMILPYSVLFIENLNYFFLMMGFLGILVFINHFILSLIALIKINSNNN
jgi:hypothetical protein